MRLYFKYVKAHNFLSIGDVELDLSNKGYVLVEGSNNNPKDNSTSNGSGKSTIFNSICWALTGETIQGLKTSIPNIYGDDGCYVELSFNLDKDEYAITRYREYNKKNDLKIIVNGEDRSGKGLRESENLLKQYLSALDVNIIGNVIILGQGLPHKFSNNTPSGRKELLEQLSNSDIMIWDVKNRVSKRLDELNSELRVNEDINLKYNTQLDMIQNNINNVSNNISNLQDVYKLKDEIDKAKQCISYTNTEISGDTSILNSVQQDLNDRRIELTNLLADKQSMLNDATSTITEEIDAFRSNLNTYMAKIYTLELEIDKLDNPVDTCPTCGQKLPHIHKLDTTSQKKELDTLINKRNILQSQLDDAESHKKDIICNVEAEFSSKLKYLQESIENNTAHVNRLISLISLNKEKYSDKILELNNLENELNNYEINRVRLEDELTSLNDSKVDLVDKITYNNNVINDIHDHIDVVCEIKTLVNRDFRGLLLTNVIDFINSKAKQYCSLVFGTDDLNLYLDGNNINIDFCNKALENLSGGEQQKINIIIQLAIRNMMCQYLNFSSNILVLDEIFDQLDLLGCSKILDLINYAINDVESLFVISHHSNELNIPYDSKITIVKDENGVSNLR